MKILVVILGALFWVSFYFSPAYAELLKERVVDVGAEISHITYEEPGVMEEKGVMYGISGSYVYHNSQSAYMLKGEGKLSFGQVDYSNSGNLDNIDDFMLEARGLVGRDFLISQTLAVTPYTGIGYRYLNDDSSGMTTSTGAKGYERESNYYYSPLGIEAIADLENGWAVGGMAEFDLFWWGRQKSHLSDANKGFSDVENDQDGGYGIRGAVRVQKKGEEIDFFVEPFIKYWDIEKSNDSDVIYQGVIVGYGYEPENNSTEIGLNVAIIF